jgi:uncharacterized protein
MIKKYSIVVMTVLLFFSPFCSLTLAESNPGTIYTGNLAIEYRNVTVYAPAVARTDTGYVGVISTITVTVQNNGSGRVFVDTMPLTQVDMQGSARLAVKVASALVENDINCDVNPSEYDYFFVVRTSAPVIGGPSAGAVMTVATISLLENWSMSNTTVMTGMINPDGSVGPIGGITHKIDAAYSVGAKRFLIPKGQGTYTEMVTTTESSNGWIRTVTKPVTHNVADYAWDNYGIEVFEVAEVTEAVENFTGYNFVFEEANGEITTEDYVTSMKPLASRLLNDSREMYENASSLFENTSIPNYFPNYYRDDVQQYLTNSKDTLKESRGWYEKGLYYTSTSKSFQSLISSRFVNSICDYYNSGSESYLENFLESSQNLYKKGMDLAKKSDITGFISLQCVGAAQRRASEAKQYLDAASNALENGLSSFNDVMDFLYSLAFVIERTNSIGWWIDIGTHFKDTGNLENETIENMALEYIEEAQQATVYSGVLLEEMGSTYGDSANYLNNAETLLETAWDDLDRDYPAAALFEALESLVKANLALEIIGSSAEKKLDLANKSSINNIAKSRRQGIEPILAVGYYEYAESLRNETSYDSALMYYRYSGMIAGAISFTNTTIGTASSRYVGVTDVKTKTDNLFLFWMGVVAFSMFIIGGILGLLLGLIIKRDKDDEPPIKPKTSTKPRSQKYPGGQLPRSIQDYYKKQK